MPVWNSSPHPISDIRDWVAHDRLELQPDFQRREVWSGAAKVMLIDTILKNVPMPKILVNSVLRDGSTYRIVIDGQQRVSAIMSFLRDEFALTSPCDAAYRGLKFSQMELEARNTILRYKIDLNEISEASDAELREIYSRVNKYNVSLNKQELRRADYPGDFLDLSEELAQISFFEMANIFSPAVIRRCGDVEFISELIVAVISGPQEKKLNLDSYYESLMIWDRESKSKVKEDFNAVLLDFQRIFDESFPIVRTRFRQRADLYGLFVAVHQLHLAGHSLEEKPLSPLRGDLRIIDYGAKPSSEIRLFSEYGVRCSTDANSEASRRWRVNFFREFLSGTYVGCPGIDTRTQWTEILIAISDPGMCRPSWEMSDCCACNEIIGTEDCLPVWRRSNTVFQLSNTEWVHSRCIEMSPDNWIPVGSSEG